MKHYADMLCLLCMQQQQQPLNSQQVARAELHSLLLQLTPQQRDILSKMPQDECIQLFRILRYSMALAQQHQQLQQQKGQQGSWQQPSGLRQTGPGPMQQPGLSSLFQVCSRADGTP